MMFVDIITAFVIVLNFFYSRVNSFMQSLRPNANLNQRYASKEEIQYNSQLIMSNI